MQRFIMIMSIVAQMFGIIATTIKAVEAALPEPGQGGKKLEIVRAALESAFDKVENAGVTFNDVWPTINTVITMLVGVYNSIGLFKKNS